MINASTMNMINAYTYGFILYRYIQPRGQIPDTPPCCRGAIIHTRSATSFWKLLTPGVRTKMLKTFFYTPGAQL